MNLPNFAGLYKIGKTFLMAKRPEILLGTAVVGTITGTVLAAKGGYEARGIVEQRELELGRKTDVKEKIQLTWLCYVPATIAATTGVGSVAGLHLVHVKDKRALAAASMAALEEVQGELKRYAEDVDAELTPAQREKVRGKMHQTAAQNGGYFVNDDAEVEEMYLVRDEFTGRDMYSNRNRIEDALNELNHALVRKDAMSLNDFYDRAGFQPIERGEMVGWNEGELVTLKWSSDERPGDGRPVKIFSFRTKPKEGYDRPDR